jgi:hypothetical protein
MQKIEPPENPQFYIRFRSKPTHDCNKDLTFIESEGVWIRVYKKAHLIGVDFISEASWEKNWFERNPEIYEMIKTNDKVIAKKMLSNKNSSIAFLAQEISDGNYIFIAENKIFYAQK